MNLAAMAKAKATELNSEVPALKVTADPRIASTRAGILVAPPSHDFTEKLTTWTLVVLAGSDDRGLRTFEVLSDTAEALTDHLGAFIESLTPGTYALVSDQPPVPCILARLTESN